MACARVFRGIPARIPRVSRKAGGRARSLEKAKTVPGDDGGPFRSNGVILDQDVIGLLQFIKAVVKSPTNATLPPIVPIVFRLQDTSPVLALPFDK